MFNITLPMQLNWPKIVELVEAQGKQQQDQSIGASR